MAAKVPVWVCEKCKKECGVRVNGRCLACFNAEVAREKKAEKK